jgi:hypothetical protein
MREIALHLLDLAQNSVSAGATTVHISVCEDMLADRLIVCIEDNGRGMNAETLRKVTDPFYTSRTTRKVGLGIPLLKGAAESCNGWLSISSRPGQGTCLEANFQHSHIDRMPLGDLSGTFLGLIVGQPDVRWIFQYTTKGKSGQESFEFDTAPIKEILEGMPFSQPDVLAYLRKSLDEGLGQARMALVEPQTN